MNAAQDSNVALLIDADNSPSSKIDVVLAEISKYGVANIRRAYGNWKSPRLGGWESALHEHAIRPIQQFDYVKGKNATDGAVIIDAMDLLYTQKLDAFAIMSSDSDFTPLVMRILANGLKVYGFGEKKTPDPFVNACSKFLFLETLVNAGAEESELTAAAKKPSKVLRQDTKLVQLLRNAVEASANDSGWSHLGGVGNHISNQASFDPRNYGYRKLIDLVEAIGLFEIKRDGSSILLRDSRTATTRA